MFNPRDAHDRLFHAIFSSPENAAGELRYAVRPGLASRIDWSSLEPMPTRYSDERLVTRHADLVFRARFERHDGYLFLLPEHKSQPSRWTLLQVLELKVRIWRAHRKEHRQAKLLPPVLPVIVHHGRSGWRGPRAFKELLDVDAELGALLGPHEPTFELLIDDVALETPDQVLQRPMSAPARVALFCLRQARQSRDLAAELEQRALGPLDELVRQGSLETLTTIWSYIRTTKTPAERLLQLSRRLGPAAEEAYMTSAQMLIKEGRDQGRAEGKAEVLLKLLEQKFGKPSSEVEGRVRSATIEELDRWVEHVIRADSLQEVFSD